MKPITKQIKVSSCFCIERHSNNMDAFSALNLMQSDKSYYYDAANRREDFSVTLSSHSLICPFCNQIHPLKAHRKVMSKHIQTMEQWADPQLVLLDQQPENITFFPINISTFLCPSCGCRSSNQTSGTTFTVTSQKNKVSIRCEVQDLMRILSLPYLPKSMFRIDFPLYEQIDFYLRKGRVSICVVNGRGQALQIIDITNAPNIFSSCVLSDWFYKSEALRKEIVAAFQFASRAEIPFDSQCITLEDCLFLARFIGYDRAFYTAIPYKKENFVIDNSFKHLQRLHTKKSAVDFLLSFSFAKFKSIRKQIFVKSALLFYLPECESLFSVISDVNVFRRILQCEYALDIFLTLHQHPYFIDFFKDYCEAKGAVRVYDIICAGSSPWHDLRCYLFYYCSLSQYHRTVEKMNWNKKTDFMDTFRPHTCSLPISRNPPQHANCVINGFTFKHLRNTGECFRAGKDLKNCLKSWDSFDSAIITVSYDSETVAAIATWGDSISQAYSYGNKSIDRIPGLVDAVDQWAKKNDLIFDFDSDEFIEFADE